MKTLKTILIFLFATIFIYQCSDENTTEPEIYARGDIINAIELLTLTPDQLNQYLTEIELPENIELNYTVTAMSIEYQTEDANGNLINASGGLIFPQNSAESPLLSIQHGTETHRNRVASVLPFSSVEGTIALITASNGFVTCVADYPGFGVSKELHPYVHAKSLALSVVDFLRATKNYCTENSISLNDQLFIGGYSEGGYATLATQREIEQYYDDEFSITACAPMAGPYDLLGTTKNILGKTTYGSPTYIAFLLTAYNNIYAWNRLDNMFNAPYAGMMEDLFDGTHVYSDINDALPNDLKQLLKEDFINNVLAETDEPVIAALRENSLLDFTPQAPIRLFHGDSDNTVPYENATTALQVFQDRGADIDLVTIPGGTHATSGLPAVLGMIEWLNTFRD